MSDQPTIADALFTLGQNLEAEARQIPRADILKPFFEKLGSAFKATGLDLLEQERTGIRPTSLRPTEIIDGVLATAKTASPGPLAPRATEGKEPAAAASAEESDAGEKRDADAFSAPVCAICAGPFNLGDMMCPKCGSYSWISS